MRTFGQLKYDIGQRIHDVSAARMDITGKYINAVYEDIWNAHLWKDSLIFDIPTGIPSTPSTRIMLPACIEQVLAITRSRTGDLLKPASANVLVQRQLDSAVQQAGICTYTRGGVSGVRYDLAQASRIRVSSTDASDRTSVFVRGLDPDGFEVEEMLTLTSDGSPLSQTVFSRVDFWAKQSASQGVLTLYDEYDMVLDRLSILNTSNRYVVINLSVSSGEQLYVTGKKRFRAMSNDAEVPVLPVGGALFSIALAETLRHIGKYSQAVSEEERGWTILDRVLATQDIMCDSEELTCPSIVINPEDEEI